MSRWFCCQGFRTGDGIAGHLREPGVPQAAAEEQEVLMLEAPRANTQRLEEDVAALREDNAALRRDFNRERRDNERVRKQAERLRQENERLRRHSGAQQEQWQGAPSLEMAHDAPDKGVRLLRVYHVFACVCMRCSAVGVVSLHWPHAGEVARLQAQLGALRDGMRGELARHQQHMLDLVEPPSAPRRAYRPSIKGEAPRG